MSTSSDGPSRSLSRSLSSTSGSSIVTTTVRPDPRPSHNSLDIDPDVPSSTRQFSLSSSVTLPQSPMSTPVGGTTSPTPSPASSSAPSATTLTVIIVPSVVGLFAISMLFVYFVRRSRRRRRELEDMETQFDPTSSPGNFKPTLSHVNSTPTFVQATSKGYESDSEVHFPVVTAPFRHEQENRSANASPSSALYVDLPEPSHRVAWRPEKLPDSPLRAESTPSPHARAPSMAERRTQRLLRALQDVELQQRTTPPPPPSSYGYAQ